MPQRINPNKTSSKFMMFTTLSELNCSSEYDESKSTGSLFVSIGRIDSAHTYKRSAARLNETPALVVVAGACVAEETAALDGIGNGRGDHVFP
jgi:hypothetical protein